MNNLKIRLHIFTSSENKAFVEDNVTIFQFVNLLNTTPADTACIMDSAYRQGWIEACDLAEPGKVLRRMDAARILHLYMQHVLGIPDLTDISAAGILKDLYDCRVCVNHIAQVYLRGIMDGVMIPSGNSSVIIFASQEPLRTSELLNIRLP